MSNKKNKYKSILGISFITPAMIIISIFVIGSIIYAIGLSFFNVNLFKGEYKFVGLNNYKRIFTDTQTAIAFKNTLTFSAIVVPIQTFLSLVMATVLNSGIRGKLQFRTIYFLPTLTSSAALTMIFMFLFSMNGPINEIAISLGIYDKPINFLNNAKFTLKVIMAMNIWSTIPYFMTIYLAGLQDIPQITYEAAKVDGANVVERFFYITVPQVKPVTTFVLLMGIIGTLQMFDQAFIFSNGDGGPENSTLTVSLLIYRNAFGQNNTIGFATAMALVLTIIIFIISYITRKINKSDGEGD